MKEQAYNNSKLWFAQSPHSNYFLLTYQSQDCSLGKFWHIKEYTEHCGTTQNHFGDKCRAASISLHPF
jgi:hypothetical protein